MRPSPDGPAPVRTDKGRLRLGFDLAPLSNGQIAKAPRLGALIGNPCPTRSNIVTRVNIGGRRKRRAPRPLERPTTWRAEFLQVADIWEQMAVWAETQGSNPPTEGDGSN